MFVKRNMHMELPENLLKRYWSIVFYFLHRPTCVCGLLKGYLVLEDVNDGGGPVVVVT